MRLEGQNIVVTGASAGMGRAICELFVNEGANVMGVARRAERLEKLAEELADAPGTFVPFPGDVRDRAVNEAMIATCVERFGSLDTIVLDAGVMDDTTAIGDMDDAMVRDVFETNTFGALYGMQFAVRQFLEQSGGEPAYEEVFGRIITIGSVGAAHFTAGVGYCASKAAVVQAAKHTAFMYMEEGIKSNVINPGGILTEIGFVMPPSHPFGKKRTETYNRISPGMGEAEQIASVALFLASEDSNYVNGQEIDVDGGWVNI